MNKKLLAVAVGVVGISQTSAESTADQYVNHLTQYQLPDGTFWKVPNVVANGSQLSPLAINPGGARFELWTVRNDPDTGVLTDFILDSRYVGAYVPQAQTVIRTEDPYAAIPRTRADRPFWVDITVAGMLEDPSAPEAARKVTLLHHVQSYGAGGDGVNIDRSQAILHNQAIIDKNGMVNLTFPITSVPGADRTKVRGEERFSIFTLPDYQAPPDQVSSLFLQIWPVADGSLSGMVDGDSFRFQVPTLTVTLNDLYPQSSTYAQLYQGPPALGTVGLVIDGSAIQKNDTVPDSRVMVIDDWDAKIEESGQWTMELLTITPFGVDRLDYMTFTINRDIEVNGTVTTVE